MCIEKEPNNPYENIVFHIAKAIFERPDPVSRFVFVQCEKRVKPNGKPLGSDTLRIDTFVSGLGCQPNGVGISTKGQTQGGTTDRKTVHHLLCELPHYPTDLTALVFVGDWWKTKYGQEYVQYAYDWANTKNYVVCDGLDDFRRFCEQLRKEEQKELETNGNDNVPDCQPKLIGF